MTTLIRMKKIGIDICDFHTHLLPRADHGSSSVETSICQLNLAEDCGVSRIVATPHFYPHREKLSSFLAKRKKSYTSLLPHIPSAIDVRLGAEVLFCGNIENIPEVEQLCISGSSTMLIELPFAEFDTNELSSLGALYDRGINIVIAHAERYSADIIDECLDYGASLQINASSISHGLSGDKRIIEWLDRGVVSALGTDIHGRDKSAYKNFRKAIKKIDRYIEGIKERSDIMWQSFLPYAAEIV